MSIESIKVPDLGGADAVEVIEVCVAVGDEISVDDSLVVLESDKASMEVPSPKAGKVVAIKVASGDSLSEGDIIIDLETVAGNAHSDTPPEPQPIAPESRSTPDENAVTSQAATPVSTSASTQTSSESITVPDLGGPENVDVIEVCVKVGDEISEGDSLIVLETDKASMEVPAPRGGKVVAVSVSVGDQVSKGDEIAMVQSQVPAPAVATTETAPSGSRSAEQATKPEQPAAPATTGSDSAIAPLQIASPAASNYAETGEMSEQSHSVPGIYAGPAVRKLAREMGITLAKVKGSGPRGRITKDDLKVFVKSELSNKTQRAQGSGIPELPEVDFSRFGEVVVEPLSKIHKITAENMHRSWLNVPHVTQFDDADITELEDFRQSLKAEAALRGVKLTLMPFFLKACAAALKANPSFNASISADGESMIYKHYVHIGMAVDTPTGLMVPVIRDVDKKSIWELSAEVAELAQKAKDRKLSMAEMQGGCFSISSLGSIGGHGFTPIVNTPEVGILGVSKLAVKPVWNGSEFVPRKMLPLSLSYDHRAVNGGDAGRFLTHLNELLADIRRLIM